MSRWRLQRSRGGAADCVSLHFVGDAESLASAEARLKEYITSQNTLRGGSGTTGSVSFDAKLTFLAAPERTRNALCHFMLVRCELPQLTAIKTNALPTSLPLSYVEWSVRDNVSDDIARQFLFDGEDGLDEARRRAKNRVSLLKIADRAAFETLPPRPHWCFEEGSKVTVHDSAASVRYSQNGNNQDHSISNCAHSFLLSTFLILQ